MAGFKYFHVKLCLKILHGLANHMGLKSGGGLYKKVLISSSPKRNYKRNSVVWLFGKILGSGLNRELFRHPPLYK